MSHWHDDEPCDLTDKECDDLINKIHPKKDKTITVSITSCCIGFAWLVAENKGRVK